MRIAPTFNVAYRALRRNKMRSVLTALGIIIGVGAVIAMVGVGNGAKAEVESQIASLGENVILIFSGSTTSSGIRTGWGGAGTLKIEDADAIRRSRRRRRALRDEWRQRRSCFDNAGCRRKSKLVHAHLRGISRLLRHSPMATGRRCTLHAARRAQRKQGLRHWPH